MASSIPELQGHNLCKYSDDYRRYNQCTPYQLIPFIW